MFLKRNDLAVAVSLAFVPCFIVACGGGGGSSAPASTDTQNWAADIGTIDTEHQFIYVTPEEGCSIGNGDLVVKGDYYGNNTTAYAHQGSSSEVLGAWPGTVLTKLDGCTSTFYKLTPPSSLTGYSIIINDNGQGNVVKGAHFYAPNTPCFLMTAEDAGSFTSAEACGIASTEPLADSTYIYNGSDKVATGTELTITETSMDSANKYLDLALITEGVGVTAETQGTYWIGSDESQAVAFTNGQVIRIGDKISLNVGEKKSVVLNVKYNDATAQYTITKVKEDKSDECRMGKPEKLGATWSANSTTFRIWSPDSSDVTVEIDGQSYPMAKATVSCYSDIYEVTLQGDLHGKIYQMKVAGNAVRDPYGKMVSKDGNGNVVMNMSLTEPESWASVPELKNRTDSVIYEVHVRDFTIDPTSGVDLENRGRYLGMVQTGTTYKGKTTGIDHLKELGVTHVQIQPFYDYATCSTEDSQNTSCYNWGYDPWNYNVPEDRYTSVFGTDDYITKVKEVKEMINKFHKNGIRVIMDVVYNHTFDKSVFENITSSYYLKTDLSGCGNTLDASNAMVWNMIRDSLDYWISEYHIDGFRFDLVGAFSMKDYSDWGRYINKNYADRQIMVYGEPWTGSGDNSDVTPVRTGTLHLQDAEAHVGAFNNKFRNCLKGQSDKSDTGNLGFIFDEYNKGWDDNGTDENGVTFSNNKDCVFVGVRGGVRHAGATNTDFWSAQGFTAPEQDISYVTAHDNLALRDKIEAADITGEEAKKLQAYANGIILVSQGVPFIHGGEEIGRTKVDADSLSAAPSGCSGSSHNSYCTILGNDFKWDLKADDQYGKVSDYYAKMIALRKAHPAFRMTRADDIFANVTLDDASSDHIIIFTINGKAVGDKWSTIKVVLNSTRFDEDVSDSVSGMTKVAGGLEVNESGASGDRFTADAQSVSIWYQ